MNIVRSADINMISSPNGNESGAVATPNKGATEVNVIRQHEEAGGKNPPHKHSKEEVMVMLEGSVTVTVEEESATLSAGDTLIVPANTVHYLENQGDVTAEWLIISSSGRTFEAPT
ncbi:MAG: cupin domain-containing protein, partial [Chloroflexota bacterium]